MSMTDLNHVTDWVFDLDNTLYPRTCDLFAQIDVLITNYVMDITGLPFAEARTLQKEHYRDHGTTLNGMMISHDIDPDHYLSKVHAIDYSPVQEHPELVAAIKALPGRKFIFTNADIPHSIAVLEKLGGADLFDGMFDIRAADYRPKPEQSAYDMFLSTFEIDPNKAVMFDDLQKNLKVPHELGMRTVQVVAGEDFKHDQVDAWELAQDDNHPHVHHVTNDLAAFLVS